MNQEERNIDHELEQMRQDYAALKEHYDKQQIVTDYLLQKAMKSDVNWLFMEMKLLPILSLFLIAITAAYTFIFGLDFIAIALIAVTVLYIIGVIWLYHGVRKGDIYNGDILSTAETLRKFKRKYILIEVILCTYFAVFIIYAAFYLASMKMSRQMVLNRELILILICVATYVAEYFWAKRILKSCDGIIERLKINEE